MKYSQAQTGRIFLIRLEHGDVIHESIESLARQEGIKAASLIIVGGIDRGSHLIVGPEDDLAKPIEPRELILDCMHEITGTGTLFPDEEGEPVLHMHLACGRGESTITGCVRRGVRTWHILEVILSELSETQAIRVKDPATGFMLLVP